MKKVVKSLVVLAAIPLAALAGCSSQETVYYGLGSIAKYSNKAAVADNPETTDKNEFAVATVQVDVTVAAVLFDKDGKILDVNIDVMQVKSKANDATTSVLTSAVNSASDVKSKWELGDAYGMTNPATAPKGNWYVQMNKIENWAVGKSAEEFAALEGAAADVSISLEDYKAVVAEAFATKIEAKAKKADLKVGVGMFSAQDAKQTNVTVGGAIFDKDGKIVASKFDVYQAPYVITANAIDAEKFDLAVNTDVSKKQVDSVNKVIKSKHELGNDYGMAATAPYGEWYVQANRIADLAKGKTVTELFATKGEDNVFTNKAELQISIKVSDYEKVYLEAYATSQVVDR